MFLGKALLLFATGCASGPQADNPVWLRPGAQAIENPILIAPGEPKPFAYAEEFEKILDVLDDYFVIAYANRYDGRIETHPLIAPGFEQPWKPGSPDPGERLLATLQTIRYRCIVLIRAAEPGGYLVQVTVLKELEDKRQPDRALPGGASFRDVPTVERQFEVVDPLVPKDASGIWIPKGRECALEQEILQRIRKCQ